MGTVQCTRCGKEVGLEEITVFETDPLEKPPGWVSRKFNICPECKMEILRMAPPPEVEFFPEAVAGLKDPNHAPYYTRTQEYKRLFGDLPKRELPEFKYKSTE